MTRIYRKAKMKVTHSVEYVPGDRLRWIGDDENRKPIYITELEYFGRSLLCFAQVVKDFEEAEKWILP